MKEEKIYMAVRESKQNLIKYINDLILRTLDEELKEDLRKLRNFVERFEPCKQMEAIELDRKIKAIIETYSLRTLKHQNILSKDDTESALKSSVYNEANKKMFERVSVMLENMLTERAYIYASAVYSKKELKTLSDFERTEYEERIRLSNNSAKQWNLNATLTKFELERLQIFYKRELEKKNRDRLYERWDEDEANASSYRTQIAASDKAIGSLNQQELIILQEIANHKELLTLFGDLNLEEFIKNNQYAGEKIENIFSETVAKTMKLQKARKEKQTSIDSIIKGYDEFRAEGVPKTAESAMSAIDLEHERRKKMKMEAQLGDTGSKPTTTGEVKKDEKAGE